MSKEKDDNAPKVLIRLHNLVQFLKEQGDKGASLERIRENIYNTEDSEAFRKKFSRDRVKLGKMYSEYYNGDYYNEDYEDEDDEAEVKIYKKDKKYYLKSKFVFMSPMAINEYEFQALAAGVKLAGHFIKPLEASASSLWKRLEKQFESKMKKGERLSQSISIAMPVSEVDKSGHEVFKKTIEAIDDKKVLKIRQYEERDGKHSSYTISPYALFFKYHAWYLMGISAEINASSPAILRLNRMKMPEILPDGEFIECPYSPEELKKNIELDFNPYEPYKKYLVKLRITGSYAKPAMETEWYKDEKKKIVKVAANGGIEEILYEVELKGLERITQWIMHALDCFEVLEPKELKDEIDRRVATYLERGRRALHET